MWLQPPFFSINEWPKKLRLNKNYKNNRKIIKLHLGQFLAFLFSLNLAKF